jgi:hypothetical protein
VQTEHAMQERPASAPPRQNRNASLHEPAACLHPKTQQLCRLPPPRPHTAGHVRRLVRAGSDPRRLQSASATRSSQLQSPGDHIHTLSWHCGNIDGTGHMLGPIVPSPDSQKFSSAQQARNQTYQPASCAVNPQAARSVHIPGATSSHLAQSKLVVWVIDRLTAKPIPGAAVLLVNVRSQFVSLSIFDAMLSRSNSMFLSIGTRWCANKWMGR